PIGRVITMASPGRTSRFGRPRAPLTSTLPPLTACCAADRVLNRHATSSHTSRRTGASPMPGGTSAGRPASASRPGAAREAPASRGVWRSGWVSVLRMGVAPAIVKRMGFLVQWFVVAIALAVTAYIVPGVIIESGVALAVAALVLGLVNALVRPILTLLTLPLTILTLGLFYLV